MKTLLSTLFNYFFGFDLAFGLCHLSFSIIYVFRKTGNSGF